MRTVKIAAAGFFDIAWDETGIDILIPYVYEGVQYSTLLSSLVTASKEIFFSACIKQSLMQFPGGSYDQY